jgi:energy-coupling factor transport system permease protein
MTADRLDSRAWLAWGVGATVPILVARNPLIVLEVLIVALAVRAVWSSRSREGWQWILRIAVVFMLVRVVFNALTVHAGDQVLFRVPDLLPLVGGRITLNAVVYGIVSGVAIVTLVLVGTTMAAGLVWAELMRSLLPRIAPIAVAGSVAWSFLPSAAQAFKEIRESQASRGHRVRGVRDLPPLVVPLLGGSLERAIAMSEALEARGFGHRAVEPASSSFARWFLVGALGSATLMAYAFAVGQMITGSIGTALALVLMLLATRAGGPMVRRPTRYRPVGWSQADLIVAGAAIVSVATFLWRRIKVPEAAIFNPYPNLEWPPTDLGMLISLSLLIVPALVVPAAGELS